MGRISLKVGAILIFTYYLIDARSSPLAQQVKPLAPRPDWEARERWAAKSPVSGKVRVGVMNITDTRETKVDPERLFVNLPARASPILCVSVNSEDGRYLATLEYEVASLPAGPTELLRPTRYKEVLANYSSRQ